MAKQQIDINDFDLFIDTMKMTTRLVDSVKLMISQSGVEIYCVSRKSIARCELTTNALVSNDSISFCIENVASFLKVLMTVKDTHNGDYSGLKFYADLPFIRFESKKLKTKYATCNEEILSKWIANKWTTSLTPVFEFTSTSDIMKKLASHSFLFSKPEDIRIYLEVKPDMENNALFATLGNKSTNLNNELTMKFGLVTFGSMNEYDNDGNIVKERKMIIDLDRLAILNALQSDNIKMSLMNLQVLVSNMKQTGKNNTFLNTTIYCSLLKN